MEQQKKRQENIEKTQQDCVSIEHSKTSQRKDQLSKKEEKSHGVMCQVKNTQEQQAQHMQKKDQQR